MRSLKTCQDAANYNINQSIVINQIPEDLSGWCKLQYKSINCDNSDPSNPSYRPQIHIRDQFGIAGHCAKHCFWEPPGSPNWEKARSVLGQCLAEDVLHFIGFLPGTPQPQIPIRDQFGIARHFLKYCFWEPPTLSECWKLQYKSLNCDNLDPSRPVRMPKITI